MTAPPVSSFPPYLPPMPASDPPSLPALESAADRWKLAERALGAACSAAGRPDGDRETARALVAKARERERDAEFAFWAELRRVLGLPTVRETGA